MAVRRIAALVVAVGLLGGCRWDGDDGRDRNPANQPQYARQTAAPVATVDRADAGHVVRGPVFAGDRATFRLVDGSDSVRVRTGDLGGEMFEVATPESSRSAPRVQVNGSSVIAGLRSSGDGGPAVVQVVLSITVRWSIELAGGAADEVVDLSAGPGGDITFTAGTSRAEAILPRAAGTQLVSLRGGAGQFTVRLTGDAPARVSATGGAGSVVIDGQTRTGVPANSTWTPDGWATATDRYDIQATAGVSTLTVVHN